MLDLKNSISKHLQDKVRQLYNLDIEIDLDTPEVQFGDFSSNVAMRLASQLNRPPKEVAEEICRALVDESIRSEIAGPGFINIFVGDNDLWQAALLRTINLYDGEVYVVEYSCPNYFKELHAGHLYQTLAGDVIAKVIEKSGAKVYRTNFGGDVGLHVARAMWGIINHLGGRNPKALDQVSEQERARFISQRYVEGSKAYEGNKEEKAEIEQLNKDIYLIHSSADKSSKLAQIYFTCRQWSREYFERLYSELRVSKFDRYYPESETESLGIEVVITNIENGVFVRSKGAIVFEGEKHNLHTRVFITSDGLPTYETKDIGLILMELEEYSFDHRILITGSDQQEYMKVVWKALDQIKPGIESKMTHLTNGLIKFGDGKKMSSRLGNVTTAVDVLSAVRKLVKVSDDEQRDEIVMLGAVKYEFLRHRLGGDIAFNPTASVSLQGDSGPYLQYAYVRALSVINKSQRAEPADLPENFVFEPSERNLVRKLAEYQLVVARVATEYMPHYLCSYLYELAQEFNTFYEKNRVIDNPRESLRLTVVDCYAKTLKHGLSLLGIEVPKKM